MDKKIIKNHLSKRFISEETTPGISVTQKARTESGKINKAGVADIAKDVTSYDKSLKKEDPNMNKMATNKYNYTDEAEKTYHEEMEILNGQEMIEYSREPGSEFKKRAEEGIVGSSRMGNAIGANAEEVWGASSDDFGKKLVKRIKDSSKKRADAEIQTYGMGDVQIPTGNKVQVATTAMAAGKPKGDTTKVTQSASDKPKTKVVKENSEDFNNGEDHEKISREVEFGINPNSTNNDDNDDETSKNKENNEKPKIKESMKRLRFDKPFNGFGNALKLIPEGYRVDKKEFEMTDGNETYRIRWEGNLTEGKGIILTGKDSKLVNEDITRMKALFGYKSQDTLGLVKGNARIDENKIFGENLSKFKKLLGESEDIEDADATEGSAESLDNAVNVAPEAKKHIQGSVSTDKGTQAPSPKKGNWEEINVPQAAEAKKHIEGTTSDDKGTQAPSPKEGNWEEVKKKAPEATKAVESGKPTSMATDKAKVVKENEVVGGEEEENEEPETQDTWHKPSDDDGGEEKEPTAVDIKSEVPPAIGGDDDEVAAIPAAPAAATSLKFSPSTGEYWIMQGEKGTKVPQEYLEIASNKGLGLGSKRAQIILDKMQDAVDNGEDAGNGIEEYGDEHPIQTKDAIAGMK